MSRVRTSPLALWLSLVVALAFAIVPMPAVLEPFRPPWVTMVVIYWTMMWPRLAGPFTAFVVGLALDVLHGTLLGQHALSLTAVSFVTLYFHLQIRIFPLWQLTATAGVLMLIDAFIVFWTDGIAGGPEAGLSRWSQVLAGTLAWAPVMALLDNLRLRAENRSKRFS